MDALSQRARQVPCPEAIVCTLTSFAHLAAVFRHGLHLLMKNPRRLLLAVGILALGAGLPVFAVDNQQVTVTATVPVMMNLTIDISTVTFAFTQSDYAADGNGTKEVVNATTLKVASNTRWILEVGADSPSFTYSGVEVVTKPCGDLQLSPNGTTAYSPVTNINRELVRGEAGGTTAVGNSIPVSYKLNTTVAGDPPGSYVLTLTYTLVAQ
jgi:hypothetical protein